MFTPFLPLPISTKELERAAPQSYIDPAKVYPNADTVVIARHKEAFAYICNNVMTYIQTMNKGEIMINLTQVDIDAAVALCIANGMKEMAGTDGELHPDELSLIDGFTAEIKKDFPDIDVENTVVDISVLNNERTNSFLAVSTYVALADRIKDEEVALHKYIDTFQANITPQDLIQNWAQHLLPNTRYYCLS